MEKVEEIGFDIRIIEEMLLFEKKDMNTFKEARLLEKAWDNAKNYFER